MLRTRLSRVEDPGTTYFVTFVLYDRHLCDLTRTQLGEVIVKALRHFDGRRYLLFDYVVMPDHVHFLIKPLRRGLAEAGGTPAPRGGEMYGRGVQAGEAGETPALRGGGREGRSAGVEYEPLSRIYHSLKSYTAHEINRIVGRSGQVWEDGTYDHVIRNRLDFEEKAHYIFMNAVNKGLTKDPAKWEWWGRGSGIQ